VSAAFAGKVSGFINSSRGDAGDDGPVAVSFLRGNGGSPLREAD